MTNTPSGTAIIPRGSTVNPPGEARSGGAFHSGQVDRPGLHPVRVRRRAARPEEAGHADRRQMKECELMAKPFKGVVNVDITKSTPDWGPYAQPIAPE